MKLLKRLFEKGEEKEKRENKGFDPDRRNFLKTGVTFIGGVLVGKLANDIFGSHQPTPCNCYWDSSGDREIDNLLRGIGNAVKEKDYERAIDLSRKLNNELGRDAYATAMDNFIKGLQKTGEFTKILNKYTKNRGLDGLYDPNFWYEVGSMGFYMKEFGNVPGKKVCKKIEMDGKYRLECEWKGGPPSKECMKAYEKGLEEYCRSNNLSFDKLCQKEGIPKDYFSKL